MLKLDAAAKYLDEYIRQYREEYSRFTEPPPHGGGYPQIIISPYIDTTQLTLYLTDDGAVVADYNWDGDSDWKEPGMASVMMTDGPGTSPSPVSTYSHTTKYGLIIHVEYHRLPWKTLISQLSFGIFEGSLNLHLPSSDTNYWNPHMVRDMGLATHQGGSKYVKYMEMLRHVTPAAWDPKTIWARVPNDIRRDFVAAIELSDKSGGTIHMPFKKSEIGPRIIKDRLEPLKVSIDSFEDLLNDNPSGDESIFHNFLKDNPVLLDVYGTAISKPKFEYPSGELSPTGKQYVEPDYLIKYPDRTYRLIELERPSHKFSTKIGHPRTEVTHAAYQLAEWKHFIQNFYSVLREKYPGIGSGCKYSIVISRSTQSAFSTTSSIDDYISLVRQQFPDTDILTYDNLVDRAKTALLLLSSMSAAS